MGDEENKELNNPNPNPNPNGEENKQQEKTPEELQEEARQSILDNIEKMEEDGDGSGSGDDEGNDEGNDGGKPGASAPPEENPNPQDNPNPADEHHDNPADKVNPPDNKNPNPKADPTDTDEGLIASVKSERGKARLQKILSERKQFRDQAEGFARQVKDSGLDNESFGNILSIARLCSSASVEDQAKGLELLENVRTALYQSMGREAPGIDLLKDAPEELRQKVESMAISREDALAIMNARRHEAEQQALLKRQAEQQMNMAQYQQKVTALGKQVEQMFVAKSQDLDFNEKMKRISEYFANRENLMEFVKSTPPERWGAAMMWMYNNMGVAQKKPEVNNPIITSRQTRSIGSAIPGAMVGGVDSIEKRMKEMGI